MTADAVPVLLALTLCAGALAAATAAVLARTLFSAAMNAAVSGAMIASALAMLDRGDGALIVALAAALWSPMLLLATMLLTTRTARPAKRMIGIVAIVLAAPVALALVLPVLEPRALNTVAPDDAQLGFWLAPLLAAAACAVVALLGYGERGVFGGDRP